MNSLYEIIYFESQSNCSKQSLIPMAIVLKKTQVADEIVQHPSHVFKLNDQVLKQHLQAHFTSLLNSQHTFFVALSITSTVGSVTSAIFTCSTGS